VRTALFLVKNGIGFGHIRRALLVAEAVQSLGQLRPVVVSQASSLALYRHSRVRVVNFPLLHRVPSAVAEDWYTDLLNMLVQRLDPAVVIEDTYPDARYQRLPALADRPRLLLMRRLDGLSFDQIRSRGAFDHYDEILIAQDEETFQDEGHSGESLTAVQRSGRFTFVGNIAYLPTPQEITEARTTYASDHRPLVVVNGGAGGDQMPDGYGDRLFTTCHQIAARLAAEGHPARFVLVTGPYYAGHSLADTPNVLVRTFEPNLAALLGAADVAVIKPGNNALSEALSGAAHLILVPDVSFMEGVNEHAARIVGRFGGAVGTPEPASLEPLIRDALVQPPRTARPAAPAAGLERVVEAVHAHSSRGRPASVPAKALLLILSPPADTCDAVTHATLPPRLRSAIVLDEPNPSGVSTLTTITASQRPAPEAVLVDESTHIVPQDLADRGVRLLLHTGSIATISRRLRLHPSRPALLTAEAHVHRGRPESFTRRVSRLLRHDTHAVLLVDLEGVGTPTVSAYLDHIANWLDRQPIRLVDASTFTAELAQRLLAGEAQ
jgi:hypothetical protein